MTSNHHINAQSSFDGQNPPQHQAIRMRLIIALLISLLVPISLGHAQSWDAKALSKKPEAPAAKRKDAVGGMKPCPEYGAGFYRLGGSDTCARVGGSIGVDVGTSGVRR